ncbi:penicillin-binding transpeptidase domain-containing protein [Algibacter miyuki]|uniref:penicillin-binding transpeptidase domain-containing protein n=1 Tax=Algibacter miyuki TaxID=1306933 RepID=UPI0025B3F8C7|nr:penicillin-binding transpeptidase domain-containing protein [Algibacter miyuki]MDN3667611.1 penicillin-binding transpeptidase domain-containing protein [Algibacter miyuki]
MILNKKYFAIYFITFFSGPLFSQEIKPDSLALQALKEVVVTGQYNPQSIKKSAHNVTVIRREQIDNQAANNLADLLNFNLNLTIIPNSKTGKSTISFFGLDAQYFNILVDNIPLVSDNGFGNNIDLTQINLDDVERIEIVEGAMGVEYGANAISGVINIITKKSIDTDWNIKTSIQEETVSNEYALFDEGRHIQALNLSHNFNSTWFARAGINRNQFAGFYNDKQGKNYYNDDGLRGYDWLPKTQINTNALINFKKENFRLLYKFEYFNELIDYYDTSVRANIDTQTQTSNPVATDKTFTTNRFVNNISINTLDIGMQQMAEDAMKEHLAVLQNNFEASYGNRAPWKNNKKLIEGALKRLPLYKKYKEAGLSESQIHDSLAVKRETELFQWKGDTIQNISVLDSLQHYLKFLNTGMLSIAPKTGAIRTYVGGIDYRYFKYDHISQSERQVGSTFKPFVYTAAIENGMEPCTYFSLAEVTYSNYNGWTPSNSGGENEDEHLNYNLEMALSNSVNTIAVKVLNEVGIPKVLEQAKKMGINKALPNLPSIALGVAEINLKELTGAYASYVNNSKPVTPYAITKVTDRNGRVIAEFEPEVAEPAFKDYTRQVMLEIMQSTVNKGTASRLRTAYGLRNDIAGKTGTTQDNKDGWFVGITPNLVTVTWVGNDNQAIGFRTTGLGQGANSALPIFAKFYSKLNEDSTYNGITKSRFEAPADQVISDLDCNEEKRDGFFKEYSVVKRRSGNLKAIKTS